MQEHKAKRVWNRCMADTQPGFHITDMRQMTEKDFSKEMQCRVFALRRFQQHNFRHQGEYIYDEYRNKDYSTGVINRTRSWRQLMTIEKYLDREISRFTNLTMWNNMNWGNNLANVAAKLATSWDPCFPILQRHRRTWSFRNGVYVLDGTGKNARDKFYHFKNGNIPEDLVACKYFDIVFDCFDNVGMGWTKDPKTQIITMDDGTPLPLNSPDPPPSVRTIETTSIQTIFTAQGWSNGMVDTFWYMWGRNMYELGTDNWEKGMFFVGVAGTGKSTLCRHMINIYESENTGSLSNSVETPFGIYPIYGKFMWYCLEVRKNWGLGVAEFQNMISGEEMSLAIKHKLAITVRWNVPGLFAGNDIPNFKDSCGSIPRRILMFPFNHVVKDGDTKLLRKLSQEMDKHIRKAGLWYLYQRLIVGDKKLDSKLCKEFTDTANEIRASTSPLEAFMQSGIVKEGDKKTTWMPRHMFIKAFTAFCDSENIPTPQVDKASTRSIFATHNITESMIQNRLYDGNKFVKSTVFLSGIDLSHRCGRSKDKIRDTGAFIPSEQIDDDRAESRSHSNRQYDSDEDQLPKKKSLMYNKKTSGKNKNVANSGDGETNDSTDGINSSSALFKSVAIHNVVPLDLDDI